jgi:hypothetical protein
MIPHDPASLAYATATSLALGSRRAALKPGRTICAKCSGRLRKSRRNLRPSFSNRRTGPSRPESGNRAGDDGDQRKKGSQVPAAVETLGHVLALKSGAGQRAGARPGRRVNGRGPGGHGCEKSKGPSPIKATPAKTPQKRPPGQESAWWWSSSRKPERALSFGPSAGSWHAPLLGPPDSGALPETNERLPSSRAGLHRLAFLTLMLNSVFH